MRKIISFIEELIYLTNTDSISWLESSLWQPLDVDSDGTSYQTCFHNQFIEVYKYDASPCVGFEIDHVHFRIGFWRARKLWRALKRASKRNRKSMREASASSVLNKL